MTLSDIAGEMPFEEALALFDGLVPVDLDHMIGDWTGGEIRTGHPLEGLLTTSGWDGKTFINSETVHPLVFRGLDGKRFAGNPSRMPLGLMMKVKLPEADWIRKLFLACKFLYATRKPAARLRMTDFRGKTSATMIYDRKPINDVFRKLDEDRVMGCMDLRGQERYYFFWLKRL